MRHFVAGLLLSILSFNSAADEWDGALRLDSYDALGEYWKADEIPMEAFRNLLRFRETLRVEMDLLVREDGTVISRITGPSGNDAYDSAVREAVEQYQFQPTPENDPPTAVVVPYYRSQGRRQ